MDGLFVIDKPAGCTSHDVVARVRKILGIRRAGHGGTLDPDATGVLLVAVGRATRFFPYLAGEEKSYEGTIRLGYSTDTYDASGRRVSEDSSDFPSPQALRAAMKRFEGELSQVPPAYSAKKIRGRPMYEMARAGREFDRKPSRVFVRTFVLRDYRPPFVEFTTTCSAGTYVRSLAHDLGAAIGCGAHLLVLRRMSVGPYTVGEAVDLPGLEAAVAAGTAGSRLIPLEGLLPGAPRLDVPPEALDRLLNGTPLAPGDLQLRAGSLVPGALYRLMDSSGRLAALAKASARGDGIQPVLVIR
jgi:tRNA pseudouridine55 synthase